MNPRSGPTYSWFWRDATSLGFFLRLLLLERARAGQDACHRIVPFVARRLVNLIGFLIGLRQRNFDRPGPRKRRGVLDRRSEHEEIWTLSRVAFDQMQVLTGALKVRLAPNDPEIEGIFRE